MSMPWSNSIPVTLLGPSRSAFARVADAAGGTVAAARRKDRLEPLADELPGLIVIAADVTDVSATERLAADAIDRAGCVDVLVINVASILSRLGVARAERRVRRREGRRRTTDPELGCQWATQGVRLNAIAPGFFPSDSMEPVARSERSRPTSVVAAPCGASARSTNSTVHCCSAPVMPRRM
jgi:NAD(P)-dependent dehydrogenase (short-subunit alcohol dehydrogenase family)